MRWWLAAGSSAHLPSTRTSAAMEARPLKSALSNPRGENPVHTHAVVSELKEKERVSEVGVVIENSGMFQAEKWKTRKSKINERCLPSLLNQVERLLVPPIHHCHCLFKPVSRADGQTGAWLVGTYVLLSFKPHCAALSLAPETHHSTVAVKSLHLLVNP